MICQALDYWLGMCLAFLFATLIEFTIVNNYTRRWQSGLRKANIPLSYDTIATRLMVLHATQGVAEFHSCFDEYLCSGMLKFGIPE